MSAHTPGPWVVDEQWDERIRVCADRWHEYEITALTVDLSPLDEEVRQPVREEMQANARLIAAAPELLEALEELAGRYPYKRAGVLVRANDAIKKAKGETLERAARAAALEPAAVVAPASNCVCTTCNACRARAGIAVPVDADEAQQARAWPCPGCGDSANPRWRATDAGRSS